MIDIDFATRFGAADCVVVTDNVNRPLVTQTDAGRLERLGAVLAGLGGGWHVPPGGVPIAPLRLNFRRDGAALGNVEVGPSFLAAHVDGTFLSRESDPQTAARLLDAVEAGHLAAPW